MACVVMEDAARCLEVLQRVGGRSLGNGLDQLHWADLTRPHPPDRANPEADQHT